MTTPMNSNNLDKSKTSTTGVTRTGRRQPHLILLILLITLALTANSCALANQLLNGAGGSSCQDYSREYKAADAQQGALLNTIPTTGAYSMAMTLSQDAVNNFFQRVSTFKTTIPIAGLASVTVGTPQLMVGMSVEEMRKYPTGSWLNNEPDEIRAQRFYAKVNLGANVPMLGSIAGDFLVSVPIVSRVVGTEKTEVWAELSKSELVYSKIHQNGQTYSSNPLLVKAINTARDLFFQQYFKDYKLFELKSWNIGKNQVKLIAGGAPDIDPVNHTLTFGMFTNLVQSDLYSVNWSRSKPQNADIGLHIHPELIRKMIGRMINEGEVDSTVDVAAAANQQSSSTTPSTSAVPAAAAPSSDESSFKVTLQELPESQYPRDNNFNLAFRLWRTSGGYCGYSDILAGFRMSIDENKFNFSVAPDSVRSIGASGSGVLTSLLINSLTQTSFFQQALSVANTTINFNEIEVTDSANGQTDKAQMRASSFNLTVDGNGISVYLDLG